MHFPFTTRELAEIVAAESVRGHTTQDLRGMASLESAEAGEVSFLGDAKFRKLVASTGASVVLVPTDFEDEPRADQVFLLVANPATALSRICGRIEAQLWPAPAPGVHASAVIAATAVVDPSATIGPLCVIEAGARIASGVHLQAQVFVGQNAAIGRDSWLMPGVRVLAECILHERVRLHSGVVIGADGFGYDFEDGRHAKIPQVGIVEIGADVEIGANSTIDRARFSRTLVGEGSKIDNLVQVGHNVVLGKHTILCAQVGVAGSTTMEDYVVLGGQAGVSGHLHVGRGVKAGGRAGIISNIPAGQTVMGLPAIPHMLDKRLEILRQRLPELFKDVGALKAQISELKKPSAR